MNIHSRVACERYSSQQTERERERGERERGGSEIGAVLLFSGKLLLTLSLPHNSQPHQLTN